MSSETGMTFGYARITTSQQDEALQLNAVTKVGSARLRID